MFVSFMLYVHHVYVFSDSHDKSPFSFTCIVCEKESFGYIHGNYDISA